LATAAAEAALAAAFATTMLLVSSRGSPHSCQKTLN